MDLFCFVHCALPITKFYISDENSSCIIIIHLYFWIQKMIPELDLTIGFTYFLLLFPKTIHSRSVVCWGDLMNPLNLHSPNFSDSYDQPSEFFEEATSNYSHYHLWGTQPGSRLREITDESEQIFHMPRSSRSPDNTTSLNWRDISHDIQGPLLRYFSRQKWHVISPIS